MQQNKQTKAKAREGVVMKGLVEVAKGQGMLELRSVAVPNPGPREVLIKVKTAGVCGTDIHIIPWESVSLVTEYLS